MIASRWKGKRSACAVALAMLMIVGLPATRKGVGAQLDAPDAGLVDAVLVLDGSNALDDADWSVQIEGIVLALGDRVTFPLDGSVRLGVVRASGETSLEVPLVAIDSQAVIDEIVERLRAAKRDGETPGLGHGIDAATTELRRNGRDGAVKSIIVTAQGIDHDRETLERATAVAHRAGVDRLGYIVVERPDVQFGEEAAERYFGGLTIGGGRATAVKAAFEMPSTIGVVADLLRPAPTLRALEVNQSVATWLSSTTPPLVAGKNTIVRAFIEETDKTSNKPRTLTAKLYGYDWDGNPLPGSPLSPINDREQIVVPKEATQANVRKDSTKTLNYRLPLSWTAEGGMQLGIKTRGTSLDCRTSGMEDWGSKGCLTTKHFNYVDDITIRISHAVIGTKDPQRPTMFDDVEQTERIRSLYPVPYVWGVPSSPLFFSEAPSTKDWLNRLDKARVAECSNGKGCNDFRFGYGLGGEGGIGRTPGFASVSYAQGSEARDATGYSRNRGPHELAHNLGVKHAVSERRFGSYIDGNDKRKYIRGACGEVSAAPQPSTPTWWFWDLGEGIDVPTIGVITNTSPDRLTSYGETWGIDTRFFGRNDALGIVDPTKTSELMGYCLPNDGQGRYPSDSLFKELFNVLSRRPANRPAGVAAQEVMTDPIGGANGMHTLERSQEMLVVGGLLDLKSSKVTWDPVLPITASVVSDHPEAGDYEIVVSDDDGTAISVTPVELAMTEPDLPNEEIGISMFRVAIPDPGPTASKIEIRSDGSTLSSISRSNNAPTVKVTAPAKGASVDPSTTLVWQAADQDGDPLSATVFFSPDGGSTWDTLAVDTAESSLTLSSDDLPQSSNGVFRVVVSDGFNSAEDRVEGITVPGSAPVVMINSPIVGERYTGFQNIDLDASVADRDNDADLNAIEWSSSLDGSLGTGRALSVPAASLSEGEHVLTARVTDSAGLKGEATVTITVGRLFKPYGESGGGGEEPAPTKRVSVSLQTIARNSYAFKNTAANLRYDLIRDPNGRVRSLRASGDGFTLRLDSTFLPMLYSGSVKLQRPSDGRIASGPFLALSKGKNSAKFGGLWAGTDNRWPSVGSIEIDLGSG